MNAVPAAVLSVLVQARGINQTNAQLAKTEGFLQGAAGAAGRMARQLVTGLKYASLAAAGAIGVAVKKAIDFDKEMRNVNSIAQLSEKKLGRVRDKVLELAGKTAQAPVTLAKGLYDLVSSGFNADESLRILSKSARAATAGLTTTEISTKAVAAVLNAYHLKAKMAGDTSDVLFEIVNRGVISFEELASQIGDVLPFSASLDVNLREVGASIATMTKAGISAPETMTRIKAVMVTLLKPGEALSKVIKQQGYDSGDAMVKALGFQGTLEALSRATGGSKSALAELFPNVRALGGALALTGDNAKVAQEDLAGMQDASGATARALKEQSKSISYQWNQLKATAEALGIQFGEKLLPEIGRVIKIITNPNLSTEEKFTKVFDLILRGAENALKGGIDLAKDYGPKIIGALVSSMAGAWWEMNGLGKVLSLAALVRLLGGKGALTATGQAIGRSLGLGVSQGIATTVAATAGPAMAAAEASAARGVAGPGAVFPVVASKAPFGSGAAQAAAANARLREAGTAAIGEGGLFSVPNLKREMLARGQSGGKAFWQGWTASVRGAVPKARAAFRGLGTGLARGATTWGLGGLLVGGMTKELVGGDTGKRIGSALEAAGVGAAIGSAIAPGVGTALGATLAVGIESFISGSHDDWGDQLAQDYMASLKQRIPEIKQMVRTMDLGRQGDFATSRAEVAGVQVSAQERVGRSGLRGLRSELQEELKNLEGVGASSAALDTVRQKLELVNRVVREGVETVATYKRGFDLLQSGTVTRMKDIADVTQQNVGRINDVWAHNPERWRQAMAESMAASISAIKAGMRQGVIETDVGLKRIKELTRNQRLFEGRDPLGLAKGFSASWVEVGRVNDQQIDGQIKTLQKLPKGARETAQTAMVGMARTLEKEGRLVKGSASRLQSALVTKFGKTNQQIVTETKKGVRAIGQAFSSLGPIVSGLVNSVSGYLQDLGVNVDAILKAFGVKQTVNFSVKTVKAGADAVGRAVSGIFGDNKKQSGGFIVPGTGSGDTFRTMLPVGSFIENREAVKALPFQKGGVTPVALEPGERVYLPREVRMYGQRNLEARNAAVPRFQRGGTLGKPQVMGPAGPLRDLGQSAADKSYNAAQDFIKAHKPAGGFEGLGNAPAALREAMALARSKGLEITSTIGGEHAPGSWHYKGRAFDASNGVNTPQEREYAIAAAKKWGRHILELFFDPLGWYIKNGQKISGAIGDHSDHVHTAMQLGGLLQKLAGGGFVDASSSQKNVALAIGRELLGRGLNYKGAAGVIGNAWRESLWNPASIGTGGRGLWGFDFYEQQLLEQAQKQGVSWASIPFQTEFMWSGPEPASKLKGALNSQPSAAASAKLFDSEWERSGIKAMSDRMNGAREAMRLMTGSDMEAVGGRAEGKNRKHNYQQRLKAIEQEVAQAHSAPAKLSKLWRLIKFWGRVGMFDNDEHAHIIDAVQSAAAQTKPQGAVSILSNLADYAKGHGEITGQDPSNFQSLEKAIERAQERGQEQRKKAVERQKKHVEAVKARVASKIAKRAAFPELVTQLSGLRRQADVGEEYASQLVSLEPENVTDSYVGLERGAYGEELNRLLSWRNMTVRAQEAASREIGNFESQIANIEALNIGVGPGMAAPAGRKGKQLGGLIELFAKGGKSGLGGAQNTKPDKGRGVPSDTYAQYKKVAYKIPLLEEAIANAKTMRDETWAGELEEIQGLSGPKGILGSLPSEPQAGAFGGRIFEIQNSIRELALKVGDATSGISELKQLEAQLNVDWHKRFLVSEAQRNTIRDFESAYGPGRFAGTFAKGGYIGAGEWGVAGETGEAEIVQGPARVYSPAETEAMLSGGGEPRVIINGDIVQQPGDTRDPVEVLLGSHKLKAHIEKTAREARGTGRRTPGGR
jgi:TP901 family phage tail tape measure protein